MSTTQAKAIAHYMTVIAGNVARVALMDEGIIARDGMQEPNRADAVAMVAECEREIARLLTESNL